MTLINEILLNKQLAFLRKSSLRRGSQSRSRSRSPSTQDDQPGAGVVCDAGDLPSTSGRGQPAVQAAGTGRAARKRSRFDTMQLGMQRNDVGSSGDQGAGPAAPLHSEGQGAQRTGSSGIEPSWGKQGAGGSVAKLVGSPKVAISPVVSSAQRLPASSQSSIRTLTGSDAVKFLEASNKPAPKQALTTTLAGGAAGLPSPALPGRWDESDSDLPKQAGLLSVGAKRGRRRSEWDEEYDMGKVKKVRSAKEGGIQELHREGNAFVKHWSSRGGRGGAGGRGSGRGGGRGSGRGGGRGSGRGGGRGGERGRGRAGGRGRGGGGRG